MTMNAERLVDQELKRRDMIIEALQKKKGCTEASGAPPLDVCKDCAPKVKAWLDWLEKQLAEAKEARK